MWPILTALGQQMRGAGLANDRDAWSLFREWPRDSAIYAVTEAVWLNYIRRRRNNEPPSAFYFF